MWGTYYYYLLKSIQLQNLFAVWGPCGGLVLPQRNSLLSFAAVFFGKMQLHFWCVCIIFEWAQCGTASQWTKLSWVDQNSNKKPASHWSVKATQRRPGLIVALRSDSNTASASAHGIFSLWCFLVTHLHTVACGFASTKKTWWSALLTPLNWIRSCARWPMTSVTFLNLRRQCSSAAVTSCIALSLESFEKLLATIMSAKLLQLKQVSINHFTANLF